MLSRALSSLTPLSLTMLARVVGLFALATSATLVGCGDDARPPSCDTAPQPSCEASIPSTYDAIYDRVFRQSCGGPSTGASCHGPEGKKGGLLLADPEQAYHYLLGDVDGRARVTAGSAACSELMQRLDSDDASFRMPLGPPKLSEGLRCAVRQWIATGAER
jgi:hypothetical protein